VKPLCVESGRPFPGVGEGRQRIVRQPGRERIGPSNQARGWRSPLAGLLLAAGLSGACGKGPPARESPPASAPPQRASASALRVAGPVSSDGSATAFEAVVPRLVRALEANRKTFTGQTGTVQGFGAGGAYPQIWVRDSATLLPLSRHLYGRGPLVSWLEEHLSHQRQDGQLYDWIALGEPARFSRDAPRCVQVYRAGSLVLTADKNTTEADQESSAVHAAHGYVEICGDRAWLLKRIGGRSVIERLESALGFLFRDRFDARLGLVTSALTADWGDVSPAHADQRAIYLDAETPVVGGLYTNAMAFRSALELAWLQRAVGDEAAARRWTARAEGLRHSVQARLWQERRGFFRIHVHASGPRLAYDDSDIFALGGNGLAVLAGLATPQQAVRISAVAAERHAAHGLSTFGGVLLPPYPRGFFKHPILAGEFGYQNGGVWDWFAGPFILAEYRLGRSDAARRHLRGILDRVRRTDGVFEWTTPKGEGRGSPEYSASAAALAGAILEGELGVALRAGRLDIRTRGCGSPVSLDLPEPATGSRVAYTCGPSPSGLHLGFETERVAPGRLCVLVPRCAAGVTARLSGQPVPLALERVGEDRYACLDTAWGKGDLELTWGEPATASPCGGERSPLRSTSGRGPPTRRTPRGSPASGSRSSGAP
jgi:hypothetical protein